MEWNKRLRRHTFSSEDIAHRLEDDSQVNNLRKLRDIRSGLRNEKEVRENLKEMTDIEQAIYFDHNALGTDCGCVSTINIKDPNNYIIINGVKEE